MKIKHIIATDFMSQWGSGPDVFPDSILELRYNQFNDFFVKTLANQTCKDFKVFVTLHDKIPDTRYAKIIKRAEELGYLWGRRGQLIEQVKKEWFSSDRLIMSRLDLDDLVNNECVSKIHKLAEGVTKPLVYGYDNCIILHGPTGRFYRVPYKYQRSQMQTAIYNTKLTPPSDFVLPNSWDNSCPLKEFKPGAAVLNTDHMSDAAVWYRHENAALFNRADELIAGYQPQTIDTDYFVRRFGTLGLSNLFDFSTVLSVNTQRLNNMYKLFDAHGLPRPRTIGGCTDKSLPDVYCRSHKAHYLAIQDAKKNKWPYVFIIEDDAYPREGCLKELNGMAYPEDADVMLVGYTHGSMKFEPGIWKKITHEETAYGLHAYVVMSTAYDKMLKYYEDTNMRKTGEHLVNGDSLQTGITCYCYGTPMFVQYTQTRSNNGVSGFYYFGEKKTTPEGFKDPKEYGL